jgi:hypothetical protein
MLDQIVTQKIQKIANTVIQQGMQEVPLGYLMGLDIPESVKHFFDQEVETWLAEEDNRISASERFDMDMPEVRMLIDQVLDLLKQYASFDQPTFNRILERAIKLELNYLIKPHQTLTQFIFKDSPKVTTIEVYNTLKYFFRLTYYKDALTDYFNQKYMQEITETQFKELISQIDAKAFEANSVEFTLKTLNAILQFANEGADDEGKTTLSSDLLIAALEDRSFTQYAELITRAEGQGMKEFTLEELENIFKTGKTPQEMAEEEKVAAEEETIAMDVSSIEEEKPEVEVSDIDVSSVPEPEPAVEEEVEEEEEFEEEEEEEEEEEVVKESGAGAQLAAQIAQQIEGQGPLEDLFSLIGKKDYKKFLKKLFKKDEPGFKDFIDELNSYNSWKDASIAIDDEFYQRQINPYSKEAIAFSDICYKRFFPKDRAKAVD